MVGELFEHIARWKGYAKSIYLLIQNLKGKSSFIQSYILMYVLFYWPIFLNGV